MCGICGYISQKSLDSSIISNMVGTLRHRGPDDLGFEIKETATGQQLAISQARLSIIDLTASGHQPMSYRHLTTVFNGEIYNYNEIKAELRTLGHKFTSDSDTEVLLQAFDEWGMDCVHRFIGMFAFVIYHAKQNKLYCCRDRAGVKPFYYSIQDGNFIFGSELKAFHSHPGFEKEIDHHAVSLFFKYRYIPAPYSIFRHTFKLMPGTWLVYDITSQHHESTTYWDIVSTYSQPLLNISYKDAKSELKKILTSACNYRMVADVPVGIFLSGGYDSTLITALIQEGSPSRLKTFTIGFTEGNNEAPFAKETASILGTDHTEYYCTEKEALEIIPELPYYYDEPFADSSAIPTILVSQLARKQVTVALSADAGDEIFIGY
ncbi:MAG: asparagine synthase (glutamine-hydrolyzing), partial [Mariniphaga sp.]